MATGANKAFELNPKVERDVEFTQDVTVGTLNGNDPRRESGRESFVDQFTKGIIFASAFAAAPCVLTAAEGNVNSYPTDVTTTGCTLNTSANFTGDVNWEAKETT